MILNWLFGKKKIVQDDVLGSLSARIKSTDPSKEYTWSSEQLISGQRKATVFLLEGNHAGPYGAQKKSVYKIIEDIDKIISEVDIELMKKPAVYDTLRSWKTAFHFEVVYPFDVQRDEFELTFSPLEENDERWVSVIWCGGQLKEISSSGMEKE